MAPGVRSASKRIEYHESSWGVKGYGGVILILLYKQMNKQRNKFRGFSPPVNYTDRATAACRRS
jgi:hypothetical protein